MVKKLLFDNINAKLLHQGNYYIPENVGPLCVDIGTNLGSFIIHNHNKFQTIIGFEPVYYTFLQCLENLKLYDINNAFVYNFGYYKYNSIIKLKQHTSQLPGNVTSHFVGNQYDETNYELSYAINLSTIFEMFEIDRINYLKIDCEGEEESLLFEKNINKIDYIGIEIHGKDSVKNFLNEKFYMIRQLSPCEFTYKNKLI